MSGGLTIQVFVVILITAALLSGVLFVHAQAALQVRKYNERAEALGSTDEVVDAVVKSLKEDPTPKADGPVDPVRLTVTQLGGDGLTVELRDVSSALDPNLARKNLFTETDLNSWFAEGKTADELQQYREDEGLSVNILEWYKEFFPEKILRERSTGYGYANINTTDEFSLRTLYRLRTGDSSAAEAFHGKVQGLLVEKKILKPEELKTFLGQDYEEIFPLINAEPQWNVHYLDVEVLREVLSYPAYEIQDPGGKAATLEALRESQELTEADLRSIIGKDEGHIIYQYLGVRTWFWEILVKGRGIEARSVIARIPDEDDKPRFRVIETSAKP